MKTSLFQKALVLALGLTMQVVALAQDKPQPNPLDEKNDPTLIGKRDINKGQLSFYGVDREMAIGRQLAAQVDRESRFVTDPLITEYVNRVAQNIVLHSDAKVPFIIKVIDSNDVNAFALPGGFLYVNRGLLEAAENEAEVAGVLAHEIAHVTARHGIEQASKGELINYASIPLIFLGGLGGYIVQQVAGLAVPLTFLKFSRGAEKEADRLGAQYMWAAGYDPNALITFFEKLQAQEKRKPGTLSKVFSTHPMVGDRIKEARTLIARFPDKTEYQVSTSEFGDIRARLLATSAANRVSGEAADSRRPTLKRRPQSQRDDEVNSSDTPDRPVLKRRDSAASDTNGTDDQTAPDEGRPTLKRREGATASPQTDKTAPSTSSTAASDAPGRPTLKRRDDPNK